MEHAPPGRVLRPERRGAHHRRTGRATTVNATSGRASNSPDAARWRAGGARRDGGLRRAERRAPPDGSATPGAGVIASHPAAVSQRDMRTQIGGARTSRPLGRPTEGMWLPEMPPGRPRTLAPSTQRISSPCSLRTRLAASYLGGGEDSWQAVDRNTSTRARHRAVPLTVSRSSRVSRRPLSQTCLRRPLATARVSRNGCVRPRRAAEGTIVTVDHEGERRAPPPLRRNALAFALRPSRRSGLTIAGPERPGSTSAGIRGEMPTTTSGLPHGRTLRAQALPLTGPAECPGMARAVRAP